MTPIGHLAAGFAAKGFEKKIPLFVSLLAAWLLDFLYLGFALVGIESVENFARPGAVPSPWSHGLLMAVVWSLAAGLAAACIYRSRSGGGVIGLVVFSHWALDFVSWNNLLVSFPGSSEVGLGLFNALGANTIFVELGLFLIGIAMYLYARSRAQRPAFADAPSAKR